MCMYVDVYVCCVRDRLRMSNHGIQTRFPEFAFVDRMGITGLAAAVLTSTNSKLHAYTRFPRTGFENFSGISGLAAAVFSIWRCVKFEISGSEISYKL